MKTIALSMIFSLAVIVCEQQTLFAPHYTDFGGRLAVTSKTSPQNSLVPVAGVNGLVPLSGTSNFCGSPKCAPSRFKLLGAVAIPAHVDKDPSDLRDSMLGCYPEGLDDSRLGKMSIHGDEGEDVMDQEYRDGAFLPWHR
jgi:hypothetical protein